MDDNLSIHHGQFMRLAQCLADDDAALAAWGLVLAHIEDDTGRVLVDEYQVARVCECSPHEAREVLRKLSAAGAVYTLPSDPAGTQDTQVFINPHVAFKGTGPAHEAALRRVSPPGIMMH